eukprot:TRINITY_DN15329_c0_g1_i1.p1 TRINITY_DN15329_c0_g1~~TRINITY_DN15329_c0_g1_i1.p1  ORF type:complete len:305 (+),score=74.46 TRINITY_DN15329_c0_g1_i1:43-915(+)
MELRLATGAAASFRPPYGKPLLRQLLGVQERGVHYTTSWVHVEMTAQATVLRGSSVEEGAVPMGRAAASTTDQSLAWFGTSVACPAEELHEQGVELPARHPHPRVGAVVIPRYKGKVLITRRGAHMRTFPKAWVFPGGSVDPGETAADAAVRELREETGLTAVPGSVRLIGVWESVYPTTAPECLAQQGIKGHHLALFFTADVADPSALMLQVSETDKAVWVPDGAWAGVCNPSPDAPCGLPPAQRAQLHGIYPNGMEEGVAQGHLFALDLLFDLSGAMRRAADAHTASL